MISSWIIRTETLADRGLPKLGRAVRLRRSARKCLKLLATFHTFTIADI